MVCPVGLHHFLFTQHALHKQQGLGHVSCALGCCYSLQGMCMPGQPGLPLSQWQGDGGLLTPDLSVHCMLTLACIMQAQGS